ncbi:MAG: hypothetical protein WD066_13145 [Planctomycetaceae bacterium]
MVGKVLAVIMAFGSVSGIITNARYLQRYGSEREGFPYAVAGLIFAAYVLVACIRVLRIRFRDRNEAA